MSEKEVHKSKRVSIRKGKRVERSSPAPLERFVRTCLSDPYSSITQQDLSVEQFGTQSSHGYGRRFAVTNNPCDQSNIHQDNIQILLSTNGKLT